MNAVPSVRTTEFYGKVTSSDKNLYYTSVERVYFSLRAAEAVRRKVRAFYNKDFCPKN